MHILLSHGGPFAAAYSAVDWAATPVGPPEDWSPTLRTTVDMMLRSKFPMTLLWGPEFVLVYNEAYVQLIGDKHPTALGKRARDVFPEAWHLIGPLLSGVISSGEAVYSVDEYVPLDRRGFVEQCWFTFCYSPVRNPDDSIAGVLDVATETTREVVFRRRMDLLGRLAAALPSTAGAEGIMRLACEVLNKAEEDFASVVLAPTPPTSPLDVIVSSAPEPVTLRTEAAPTAVVDDDYRIFVGLVASTIGQAIERARADEVQRRMSSVQREMSEAFQRSLLPSRDQFAEPQIAARYRPAVEVAQLGGDWYDFFPLPAGGLGVVIGDVAGHDQRAAAVMAQLRNLLRGVALSTPDAGPSAVLAGLERVLELSDTEAVATAVMAHVSRAHDGLEVTWSNAGHPPPLMIGAEGSVRLLQTEPDLLLGLDAGTPRSEHRVELAPGATLVLYTDGLVESRDQELDAGLERLVASLRGSQHHGLEQLCDELLALAPGSEDDVALLVLRG